jgi:hypothetical protein
MANNFMQNGLLGLGGFGGIGGGMPPGILSKYYDPAELKKQQMKQALIGAGIGLLSQGPSQTPIGFGETLGAGMRGGLLGAQQAGQDYQQNALLAADFADKAEDRAYKKSEYAYKMEERTKQSNAEAKRAKDLAFVRSQIPPEDLPLFDVDPEAYAKAKLTAQFAAQKGKGDPEYGLVPTVIQNKQTGEYRLLQPNKNGLPPRPMEIEEGWEYVPPNRSLDTGTGYVTVPTRGQGQIGEVIPKDLAGAEVQKGLGKATAEAHAAYESIKSKMPGLEKVVTALDALSEKATYTLAGQAYNAGRTQFGLEPTEGAVARTEYQAVVANQVLPLLRDTFGAAFTQKEGDTLMATLGDPDKSPTEKQAVLKAFIEQKRRDVEALAVQAGGGQPQGPKRLIFNPNTGKLE